MPLTRGGVALCNFSFPLSTTFFKVFFQRSAFGVGSFEPLCLSAFSSYARFTPFCQTLFSPFSGNFSLILRILPIKLVIGNKIFLFFLFRKAFFRQFFPRKAENAEKIPGKAENSCRKALFCPFPLNIFRRGPFSTETPFHLSLPGKHAVFRFSCRASEKNLRQTILKSMCPVPGKHAPLLRRKAHDAQNQ